LYKSIFVLSRSHVVYEEDIESLLKIAIGNPFSQASGFVPGRQNR